MNADYIRLAHRKAVWAELRRVILDRYIAEDAPAKEQIICEEVPYKNKEVTAEAILACLEEIEVLEHEEHVGMSEYEMKKREPRARRVQAAADTQPDADAVVGAPVADVPAADGEVRDQEWARANPDGSPEPKDEEGDGEDEGEGEDAPEPELKPAAPAAKRGRARSTPTG